MKKKKVVTFFFLFFFSSYCLLFPINLAEQKGLKKYNKKTKEDAREILKSVLLCHDVRLCK